VKEGYRVIVRLFEDLAIRLFCQRRHRVAQNKLPWAKTSST
jgi:hypothetical protein